ncbi:MAG: hypothetical protein QOJ07_1538 [Thermoleophilaceae bacterium]|nr:hypothetical protein [Thermoleophilaceae bacterium]
MSIGEGSSSEVVTVWADGSFQGPSQVLGPGDHTAADFGAVGDNMISSVQVPSGLAVTLFENPDFTGRSVHFTSDTAWVGDDFNDVASAVRVEAVGAPTDQAFSDFAERVRHALEDGNGAEPVPAAQANPDANALAAALLGSIAASAAQDASAGDAMQSKSPVVPLQLDNPALLGSKDFLSSVFSTVQMATPILLHAVGQLNQARGKSWGLDDVIATVPPERRHDKDWIDFVANTIQTLGPPLVQAISGQKDFRTAPDVPTLAIPAAHAGDKGWFDDALNFTTRLIPAVLPTVLAAI